MSRSEIILKKVCLEGWCRKLVFCPKVCLALGEIKKKKKKVSYSALK